MKEIIGAVIALATLFAGGYGLKQLHDSVRTAALEKASQGLPSLVEMTHALQNKKQQKNRDH